MEKMNEILTKRIIDYVQQKTNYAVVITGKYGIGKTYYVDNLLAKKILEIKSNQNKPFKFIRISLFGVSTIEEIQEKIFFELYASILNKKGVKVITGLLRGVLKKVGSISFLGLDFNNIFNNNDDIKTAIMELNNYENIILCFDDIDRKSSNLNLAEVYGFINDLVENKRAKVILIANEDTLMQECNDDNKDSYSILREKVIGISFPFKSDISKIINSLISSYEGDYEEFLTAHSSYIVEMVENKGNNLRNLIFFFEHFKKIFLETKNIISAETNNLEGIKESILSDILKFSLPICFEYKLGKLTNDNIKLLKDYYSDSFFRIKNFIKGDNSERDYIDDFKDQYNIDNIKKYSFDSIFEYIIGNNILDTNKLLNEIKNIYLPDDEQNLTEKEKVFKKLNGNDYWNFMKLSDDEYKGCVQKLIDFIDENEIELSEYITVFYYITRFDNPLNVDVEKLKNKIIHKIKNNEYEYNSLLNRHYLSISDFKEYSEFFIEIREACLERNEQIKQQNQQKQMDELFGLFENDFNKFLEQKNNYNYHSCYYSFFSQFEFEKYWEAIEKFSPYNKIEFSYFIRDRYESIYGDLALEKKFVECLKVKVENKITNEKGILEKGAFMFMNQNIDEILPKFP